MEPAGMGTGASLVSEAGISQSPLSRRSSSVSSLHQWLSSTHLSAQTGPTHVTATGSYKPTPCHGFFVGEVTGTWTLSVPAADPGTLGTWKVFYSSRILGSTEIYDLKYFHYNDIL